MKKIFVGALLALLLTTGLGCKGVSPDLARLTQPKTLTIWGLFDDQDAYQQIVNDYRVAHPYVQVVYRKFRPEEYETQLLNALAEDRGPDIFMIHNTWVRGYEPKIAPMPRAINVAELVLKGGVRKEAVYELHQKNTLSIRAFQTLFPDQVIRDTVVSVAEALPGGGTQQVQKILGLPLSIDSLVLFWNRDLLNAAGIAEPPKSWTAFQQMVKKLTRFDAQTRIIQSAAAIGTSENVARATDILSLLMLQNGTPMADESGYPAFHRIPQELADRPFPPGVEAAIFYTDFANPTKEVYTWNEKLPDSLDAFVTGQAAMMLGYNYQLPLIRARAPKLKFGISPAPQIVGNPEKNFANYWLYSVSKKSPNAPLAWDFLQYMTSEPEAKKYLAATGKPTALRSLIPAQIEDLDLGVFASQILTAESWYRGAESAAAEKAMKDMIAEILAGEKPIDAINTAAERVSQTIISRE